jgi:putative DNA methylase
MQPALTRQARDACGPRKGAVLMNEPRGWYSRGYLPHFDGGEIPQFLTFRLADAIPQVLLRQWQEELSLLEKAKAEMERRKRIEAYLDKGYGEAWLRDPELASMVQNALLFFDGQRYFLHAWVVMPNHVHALFTPIKSYTLAKITHSWKSFTSDQANKYLGRMGQFWWPESYDRFIRDENHYATTIAYIENNPYKAGLCSDPTEYPFSSAYGR